MSLVKGEVVVAFNGTQRDVLWDVELPPFDGKELGISFDSIAGPTSIVPFRYKDGKNFFIEGKGEADTQCLTFVFCLSGDNSLQENQMKTVGAFTHALKYDWDEFHTAFRVLKNEETGNIRTVIFRVYKNNGECIEHPEMWCGAPMGMYHCPQCMEMVVAGLPHPSKEAYAEMHARDVEEANDPDAPAWSEGDYEQQQGRIDRKENAEESDCLVPPYTDEQVAVLNEIEKEEEEARQKANALYAVAEQSLNTYAELEFNWGGDGEEKPIDASLKNAGEFFATLKEHSLPSPEVTLDHEGIVAFLWPDNHDPKDTYVSMAFYAGVTVTYWMERRNTETNNGLTIPRDESHEDNLLAFLYKRLPQLATAE